ncbi:sugar ABC transporter substrate-binding protein [Spirochaetia bacterium]|nr:sugar ABC transporter substrate-binding protein [Spirochaetia bacterium]
MKKSVFLTLAAVLVFTLFTGCAKPKTTASAVPALTVWLKQEVNETTNQMLKDRVLRFGKENNVNITVELIAYEKLFPMWTAAIESNNLPDVSYFQYQEAGQFYAKNLMLDVSDLAQKIQADNGPMIAALIQPAVFGGKVYAIPQKFYSPTLHYRKDLLGAAGFNAPPATWDEFRSMAKVLTDTSKGFYGAGMGLGATNSDAEWLNQVMLWAMGGSLVAKDSKTIVANSPETVAALAYMAQIYKSDGIVPPSAVNWDDAANNTAYLSGQSAMVVNAGTLLAAIKRDNADLYEKTGIAPIPAGPKGFFTPSSGSYLGIFNATKQPQLAKDLIAYLYTYDWYKNWMDVEMPSIVPVYERAKEDPAWQEERTKPFIEAMAALCFIGYPGEYTPQAGELFNLKLLNKTLENIVVNGATPQAAANALQKEIEDIYASYK